MSVINQEHCYGVARLCCLIESELKVEIKIRNKDRSLFLEFLRLIDVVNDKNTSFVGAKMVLNGMDILEALEKFRDERAQFIEECCKYSLVTKHSSWKLLMKISFFVFNKNLDIANLSSDKMDLLSAICGKRDKDSLNEMNKYLLDCYKYYVKESIYNYGRIRGWP